VPNIKGGETLEKHNIGRRPLLKALALGTAMAPFAGIARAAAPRVRYNVYSAKGQAMLNSYAKGVAAMQKRSGTDPLSWAYQAAIHGTYTSGSYAAWNTCQHGSWFFISWHRMYIYWLEEIVRSQSGDPNFTLPYWNYTDLYPDNAVMPSQFRTPTSGNPLYVSQRNAAINSGKPLGISTVQDSQALATIPFTGTPRAILSFGGGGINSPQHFSSYTGQLEQQPHNVVHTAIGGWMGDPNTAAQDPIFWLHHCNIDRLWNDWLNLGKGRQNPTSDTTWMNTSFLFFNASGTQVRMTASQILDSATQLGYVYDDLPSGGMGAIMLAAAKSTPMAAMATDEKAVGGGSDAVATDILAESDANIALGSAPLSVTLNDRSPTSSIEKSASKALFSARPSEATVLVVEGVKADTAPEILYEVYVNLADGATPDPQGLNFAGTIAFFGGIKAQMTGEHAGHGVAGGRTYSFDITRLVEAQEQAGLWKGDNPKITFVPIDGTGQPAKAKEGANPSVTKVFITAQ
jgi:tyrosinase